MIERRGKNILAKILWLNRHNPKAEQIEALGTIFGEVTVVQRIERLDPDSIVGVQQIISIIKMERADEIVCSVPIQHLQGLVDNKIFPLRAIMVRTPSNRFDGNGEREYDFDFLRFERVLKAQYEAESL